MWCAGGRNEQEDRRERSHAGARKRSRVARPAGRCRASGRLGRNMSLCHGSSRSPKTREYRAGRHQRLLHLRARFERGRADAEEPFGALSSTPRSNSQSVGPRLAAYWDAAFDFGGHGSCVASLRPSASGQPNLGGQACAWGRELECAGFGCRRSGAILRCQLANESHAPSKPQRSVPTRNVESSSRPTASSNSSVVSPRITTEAPRPLAR